MLTPEDILHGRAHPAGKVVVLDGEGTHASTGVAEMLGKAGAQVTLVSANFTPYANVQLLSFEGEFIAKGLADANVDYIAANWVRSIGERDVTIYDLNSGKERILTDIDAVVLATGRELLDGIGRALEGRVKQLFTVGDALCVRSMAAATYEAHKFARLIGEMDAPANVAQAYFAPDDPAVYPVPAG